MTRYGNTNPVSLVARLVLKSVEKGADGRRVTRSWQIRGKNETKQRKSKAARPHYVLIERVERSTRPSSDQSATKVRTKYIYIPCYDQSVVVIEW